MRILIPGLIAVLVVVGYVLMGSPSTGGRAGRIMRVDCDFSAIDSAVKMYVIDNGHPPTTAQGFSALVAEPVVGPKSKRWRPLMDRIPLDPWQTPYRYELKSPGNREWRWEFRSAGPDGVFDNEDDLAHEFEHGGSPPSRGTRQEETRPAF